MTTATRVMSGQPAGADGWYGLEADGSDFAAQYRSYIQLILVGAAIVSLAIKEWTTGVLLILITVMFVLGDRAPATGKLTKGVTR